MRKARIGLIGLGVMGANLALNIAEKGHDVAVFNRTGARTRSFMEGAGELAARIVACETVEALVAAIAPPRAIILMVEAGAAVDAQIAALRPLLADGDTIIDAGNAHFRDTERRAAALAGTGIHLLGVGVSGGEDGARHGPSIMAGGEPAAYEQVAPVLEAIAARYRGEACQAYMGAGGAGHFVKTIHNGIEYADMQMIAEVYGILRDGLGMAPADIGAVFATWNTGRLESYLVEITAKVLAARDPASGEAMVDVIVDAAGQKGTGRWSAIESQMLGVPATAIETAVAARGLSAMKEERVAAERLLGLPDTAPLLPSDRDAFIEALESALIAGKLAAYAQGFAVMAAASREFGWGLPLATIARIWRAGCIIRSRFLDEIAGGFDDAPQAPNLVVTPRFAALLGKTDAGLRASVCAATGAGLAIPALSAALSYFDGYRRGRGTANLIQAQRDFFGAHGFRRTDAEGEGRHGPWAQGA